MNRFDFYKDAYDKEIARRNSINSDLNLPIGIITGLIDAHRIELKGESMRRKRSVEPENSH